MSHAFWRKCDFQIHTPRDPNWKGKRPLGEGDINPTTGAAATPDDVDRTRADWASAFVDTCLKRGLKAIALTDHHETEMCFYVRSEIEKRKKADQTFDLWLFPGMELTTLGGRQCLILFDANISEERCKAVRGILGIDDSYLNTKRAKGPKVSQIRHEYPDLATTIEGLNEISGKYIILPNVSQGGKNTVLSDKQHGAFRRSPYIGGYLDSGQTIDSLGKTNKTRLSGTDALWSTREIYPLPTSDCRTADFSKLGTNQTWIKLAEPTAEAFLGHQSRIKIGPPDTPALVIDQIEITDSTTFESTSINLSPELNSIIGGRGSGKSSLLEYLSFGLGISCYDADRKRYSDSFRLQELINETLILNAGRVKLKLSYDGAIFIITRDASTAYQPKVVYPDGSVQRLPAEELRSLFPAIVYSQGELAEIGKQTGKQTKLADLLQFVNPDHKRDDNNSLDEINEAKQCVRKAIQAQASAWALQARQRKAITKQNSLRQRVRALEKKLPDFPRMDQKTIERFDHAYAFHEQRDQASKHVEQILQDLQASISGLSSARHLESAQGQEADDVREQYNKLINVFVNGIANLMKDIKARQRDMDKAIKRWKNHFMLMQAARDVVLKKLHAHSTVTSQIERLRKEIADLNSQLGDLDAELNAMGNPSAQLKEAMVHLRGVTESRMEHTKLWAKEVKKLSNGKIIANVKLGGDISEIAQAIETLFSGTGPQEATWVSRLGSEFRRGAVWDTLEQLQEDCIALLNWRLVGAAAGERQPSASILFSIIGDADYVRSSFIEGLDDLKVEAVAIAVPKPEIALSYCDGGRKISFEKASEGQRVAALLFMLLEQPGGPLIIDQLEDDLDNKIIAELTDKLHSAKQRRQLIFASHNANVVVNGSSELVGYLDVDDVGHRTIERAGAIDKPEIRDTITSTLEGGKKAFKERHDKYGC